MSTTPPSPEFSISMPGSQQAQTPPCFLTMEGELIAYEPGRMLTARFPNRERYENPLRFMQGGFIVAAIDNAIGPLSYSIAPSVTIQLNTSYIRPVTPADTHIEVTARLEERTSRQLFLAAQVRNPAGKLVATCYAVFSVLGT